MRPHVYRLARDCQVKGWVLNSASGVQIHAEGSAEELEHFTRSLVNDAPPLALITSCSQKEVAPEGMEDFIIRTSTGEEAITVMVSPDMAICPDCRAELLDPGNRRYAYAFTNCTNCGPRFTIIRDLPYDRARTSMAEFPMCPDCSQEYQDPLDRRFHAQPNACPVCGPRLRLLDAGGGEMKGEARSLLKRGLIVAVKGLGGFHLAVDARNAEAVQRLRQRKRRDARAFAVMARDLAAARGFAVIGDVEASWMQSARAPIVVVKSRETQFCSEGVSPLACREIHPGLGTIGVMLPYTPLHHLLFDEVLDVLVMTSANISDEPLIISNDEALDKLAGIADAFLVHDRDIENPCDDSVVTLTGVNKLQFFRRARGFVPQAIPLPFASQPVLAAGPEMKNSFCIVRDDQAFLSQHWGDLNHYLNYERYLEGRKRFQKMLDVDPRIVAHDLHPDYQATRWAQSLAECQLIPVQHHWAHMASVMAEHGLSEPVLGLICDGTGLGLDGQIWGAEILAGDCSACERLGHLDYQPYPGGDLNARRPCRMAAVHCYGVWGEEGLRLAARRMPELGQEEAELLGWQLANNGKQLMTSSCGRLFDAVSAFLGVCGSNPYEGQAAAQLEAIAAQQEGGFFPYSIEAGNRASGSESRQQLIMKLSPMWEALAEASRSLSPAVCSRRFHNTLVRMFAESLESARQLCGLNRVVLSGGVFHNQILLAGLSDILKDRGFEVFTNQAVPPGDGGISLGQAAIAAWQHRL